MKTNPDVVKRWVNEINTAAQDKSAQVRTRTSWSVVLMGPGTDGAVPEVLMGRVGGTDGAVPRAVAAVQHQENRQARRLEAGAWPLRAWSVDFQQRIQSEGLSS
eukprot:3364812-Rhodomonas_salina.1